MTRAELEHAIRAACDVLGDRRVTVIGSQSVLGQHPDAPASLRQSMEVDIIPDGPPERADLLDGALGLDSLFHAQYGFYVEGVTLDTATLPLGWEQRTRPVQNANTRHATGHCLEVHDLAASKLVAFREKDRDFIRTLLAEGLVRPTTLRQRVAQLPITADVRGVLVPWLQAVIREVCRPPESPVSP